MTLSRSIRSALVASALLWLGIGLAIAAFFLTGCASYRPTPGLDPLAPGICAQVHHRTPGLPPMDKSWTGWCKAPGL